MVDEISRSVESQFFTRMPDENLRALCLRTARKRAGDRNQRGRTGPVIVGAVVNSIRLAVGQNALGIPCVVVMGTKGRIRILESCIGSFDDADDIPGVSRVDHLIIGIYVEG